MIDLDKEIELYKSKVAFYESQNTRGEYAVTVRELKYVVEILETLRSERTQGDAISREALKKDIEENSIVLKGVQVIEVDCAKALIDNAHAVEDKQDEMLNYIKLSLEKSDEFKEKYRNKHKESNSQYDLYYSHLFEGMAEAYDDLLKKMSESEPVIEKDTYQIRKAYERGFETGIYVKSKEAIGVIEDLTKALEDNGIIAQAPEIKEALTMGIEALKREDESDTQGKQDRPQGEWIKHIDNLFPEESTEECPFCHEEQFIRLGNDDNFCPNCGADMRTKENESV